MNKLKEVKKPSKQAMKRILIAVVGVALLVGAGAFAVEKVEAYYKVKAIKAQYTLAAKQAKEMGLALIDDEEAKQIALSAAELEENQVKKLEVTFDQEEDFNHSYVYEVEFIHDGLEYEFVIDGMDKTILQSDVDGLFD